MAEILCECGFQPEIYGAFSVPKKHEKMASNLFDRLLGIGTQVLNAVVPISWTRGLKAWGKKIIGYKAIVLPYELEDFHMKSLVDVRLEPLVPSSIDTMHMFLYAIAQPLRSDS